MAKSELGTKRICPTTGKKFYDLNRSPGDLALHRRGRADRTVAPPGPRAARPPAPPQPLHTADATPEPAETEELVSLEEADAEENTGKVKAVVPEVRR